MRKCKALHQVTDITALCHALFLKTSVWQAHYKTDCRTRKVVPSGAPISSVCCFTSSLRSHSGFQSCILLRLGDQLHPVSPQRYWKAPLRGIRVNAICKRSSTLRILLVEWRKNAIADICSRSIPHPLSVTRIKEIPPSLISTVTAVALASMAFSTSSLTIEDGRSITSPAAILSIVILI